MSQNSILLSRRAALREERDRLRALAAWGRPSPRRAFSRHLRFTARGQSGADHSASRLARVIRLLGRVNARLAGDLITKEG